MTLVHQSSWFNSKTRRLEAVRAAHERDEQALLDLLLAYLSLKSKKRTTLSPRTLETYQLGVRDYLAWAWPPDSPAPKVHILKAGSDELDQWIASLQVSGGHLTDKPDPLKPSSIATYLAAVRALYKALNWAEAAQIPQDVISPRDPTPAYERRPALPLDLYKKLIKHLEGTDSSSVRDRVMVRLLGEAGLRISEVVHLYIDQLDLEQRTVRVRGKGGKVRTVPLNRGLTQELRDWLNIRTAFAKSRALIINLGAKNSGGALSPQHIRRILDRHYRDLNFPDRYSGAHMLRHTAGTRFYKASRDLHATARLLGHSNINTSAIYAKMDLEGLFEVVDKLED